MSDEFNEARRAREIQNERADDGWGHDDDTREAAIADARAAVAEAYEAAPEPLPEMPPNLRGAEREQLYALALDDARPVPPDGHKSTVLAVDVGDWVAYAKPSSGEGVERQDIPAGEQFRREHATALVDEALHFDLVPATVVRRDWELGDLSLQAHAPGDAIPVGEYDHRDQQRMAVLDYVVGQIDRHEHNYRSQDDGRPAAIDNGLTFPESNNDPLHSVFFDSIRGQALDPDVMRQVEALDQEKLEQTLRDSGISDAAVDGMRRRLDEVRSGRVTGRAYGWDI